VTGIEERLLTRADLVVALGLGRVRNAPGVVLGGPALAVSRACDAARRPRIRDAGARARWGRSSRSSRDVYATSRAPTGTVAELDRLRREGASRSVGAGLDARLVRLAREGDAGRHDRDRRCPRARCVRLRCLARDSAALSSCRRSGLAARGFALSAGIAAWLGPVSERSRRMLHGHGRARGRRERARDRGAARRTGSRSWPRRRTRRRPDSDTSMRRPSGFSVSDASRRERRFARVFARALGDAGRVADPRPLLSRRRAPRLSASRRSVAASVPRSSSSRRMVR
jgi:hypothetical protein